MPQEDGFIIQFEYLDSMPFLFRPVLHDLIS